MASLKVREEAISELAFVRDVGKTQDIALSEQVVAVRCNLVVDRVSRELRNEAPRRGGEGCERNLAADFRKFQNENI